MLETGAVELVSLDFGLAVFVTDFVFVVLLVEISTTGFLIQALQLLAQSCTSRTLEQIESRGRYFWRSGLFSDLLGH